MNWTWVPVTSLVQEGGVATLIAAEHSLLPGYEIFITGAEQADYNGWKTILTVPDANTCTFTVADTAASPATTSGVIEARTAGRIPGHSWFQFAAGALGGWPELVCNAGIGGQTTSQILARVGEVIRADVDTVIVWAGHNDLLWSSDSHSVPLANLCATCQTLISAGKHVLLLTCEPECNETVSAGSRREIIALNQALAAYAKRTAGIVLVDIYPELIDSANTDGRGIEAAYLSDGVHFSCLGAQLVGAKVASTLETMLRVFNLAPCATFSGEHQIFSNPLMAGTGGGLLNATGQAPNDVSVLRLAGAGTYLVSVAARTTAADGDAFGNNLVISCADGTISDYTFIQMADVSAKVSAGDEIYGISHIQVLGAKHITSCKIGLLIDIGGVKSWVSALEWWPGLEAGMYDINGFLRTPTIVVPAEVDLINWTMLLVPAGTGEFTIKMGRVGINRI
jgi:lysophospholipase L1-like esterase